MNNNLLTCARPVGPKAGALAIKEIRRLKDLDEPYLRTKFQAYYHLNFFLLDHLSPLINSPSI